MRVDRVCVPASMAGHWGDAMVAWTARRWVDWRVWMAASRAGKRAGWSGLQWADLRLIGGVEKGS